MNVLDCQVCGRVALGVGCSGLGAISFAYCEECAARGAEPIGVLLRIAEVNGEENYRGCITWTDGKYITFDEAQELFGPKPKRGQTS